MSDVPDIESKAMTEETGQEIGQVVVPVAQTTGEDAGIAIAQESGTKTNQEPGTEINQESGTKTNQESSTEINQESGTKTNQESSTEINQEFSTAITQEPTHQDRVMTVVEHLDELRTRILRSLVVFMVALGASFAFGKEIILFLEKPAGNMTFQALSIEEPLFVYCKVALYAALVLSLPYCLFEIAGFVSPGLKPNEKKLLVPIIAGGPFLFLIGVLFCHQFVLPPMLTFFSSFGVGISPVQQRLDFYISLVTTMMLYMGLCFQLPIVLFALSLAGIVNSRQLLGFWRYALVISSVVAAIITPDPTVFSMLIVMAALVGLYFITVLLLKLFGR